MAGAFNSVRLRDSDGRADQRVQQGKLIAHGGEAMVFHKAKRGTAGQIPPVAEKHSLPWNKYIFKHRERLDHFVLRRDGARKRVIRAVQEIGCVQAKAGGVNRYSE